MSGLRRRLMRLAMLALFLAIWEAAFRVGLLSPIIFASPSLIVSAAIKDGWTFLLAFRITVFEIAVAILRRRSANCCTTLYASLNAAQMPS